jgi:hypothetical protein
MYCCFYFINYSNIKPLKVRRLYIVSKNLNLVNAPNVLPYNEVHSVKQTDKYFVLQ